MKQEDPLSPFLINFSVEYDIRTVQANQDGMKLNGTLQLLVYVDDVNILVVIVHAIQRNIIYLVVVGREIGLEMNADKTKQTVMSRDQNAGRSHSKKCDDNSFERWE
jgi:hypothetical protein